MGIVQMNNNGPVAEEFAEPNHHLLGDQKKARDRVTLDGQEHSEEYESQINENAEDVYDGRQEAVQVHAQSQDFLLRPQQQAREPVVRWERFLPFRSLKVLLVEHDDSTRHVVNALLRNCGYEVVAVANGLQAWKILEDLTSHIDLVLTEVEPCLSGIALLYKIMSHKSRKNVPVIMMSSHDSMGIVFKCLSKGAVDFLVKPIRKNELKNLWQHIWRRCHSSSGSGSESGVRTQKSIKSKSVEDSHKNTGSSDEGIRSIGVNVRDGSDNGSGTQQSSWTKRAVEVDSPQPQSPWDQSEPQDSTCAQVIHPRPEACSNNCVPVSATKECKEQDDKLDKAVMGKDLEIGIPQILSTQCEDPGEIALKNKEVTEKGKHHEINSKEGNGHLEKEEMVLNSGKQSCESRTQAAPHSSNPLIGSEDLGNQNSLSKVSNVVMYATKEMPSLELSLKRQRDVEDAGNPAHDRNVLRHSDLSAFSRYHSVSVANPTLTANVDSCSPVGNNSSEAAKTESMQNFQSNSNNNPSNQRSNGSSNNIDMGSTTNSIFAKIANISDKPGPKSTVKNPNPSSGFPPIQDIHVTAPQTVVQLQGKADTATTDIILEQTRGSKQPFQVQHHHHHYHHHHHHVHDTKNQQQQIANNIDSSLETMTEEAPKSGSSNRLSAPITGDAGNNSLNVSGTGSNHGSNGQNMSSTPLNAEGTAKECNDEVAVRGGIDGRIGFRIMTEIDQSPCTIREAALQKFRQKRKERCFEKKVRYHSRQKLAEQRPRVRGQFVRQVMPENNNNKGKDTLS